MIDANGIEAVGAYYSNDHQYRCGKCGKPMQRGGKVTREFGTTYVSQVCKCGNKMVLKYGGN